MVHCVYLVSKALRYDTLPIRIHAFRLLTNAEGVNNHGGSRN